ncbi:MAG: two-component system sensor histidine kinase NtrB [Desulfatibacillaceae bacterium]
MWVVNSIPVMLLDIFGSVAMIVFSFLCVRLANRLKSHDDTNVIHTYLVWLSWCMALFAISRSVGHIVKQGFVISGYEWIWTSVQHYSGALNSALFIVVASVTLFFERVHSTYQVIEHERAALESAHGQVLYLNQNLESLVEERTRALAESEHKYRRIFEVSRDMILVTDRDGVVLEANPGARGFLGDFGHGGRFQDRFRDAGDWDRLWGELDSRGFVVNAEVELVTPDGAKMRSLVSGGMDLGERDGGTVHFLVRDIEQRRLMEAKMAQADKLASIGELSSGIAHEINNPLGIILGYTQLFLRNEDPESERYEDLKTIEKHVRNCKAIVGDLLNFARSGAPEKGSADLAEIVEEVLNFVGYKSGLDHIAVERDYDRSMPPVFADEKKIRQVIMNLVMNARHAVAKDGTIRISTRYDADGRTASLTVADNGDGISKKNMARIFDPFFTTKATGEGTGLGLSVSYGIVKSHGGDILVQSEEGRGAAFTVVLPANGE